MDCSTRGFPALHHLLEWTNSCPLSRWCHPTISSSVVPLSSCLQSFPASGSFPVSWLFASGGQSIYWSFSVSPSNEYSGLISFRINWFDLLAVQRTLNSLLNTLCVLPLMDTFCSCSHSWILPSKWQQNTISHKHLTLLIYMYLTTMSALLRLFQKFCYTGGKWNFMLKALVCGYEKFPSF